jgi:hypothetical protein
MIHDIDAEERLLARRAYKTRDAIVWVVLIATVLGVMIYRHEPRDWTFDDDLRNTQAACKKLYTAPALFKEREECVDATFDTVRTLRRQGVYP